MPAPTGSPATPYYEVVGYGGDRQPTKMLDKNGDVWTGFVSPVFPSPGFVRGTPATPEQQKAVADAFAQLPAVRDPSCPLTRLLAYVTDATTKEWGVCADAQGNPVPPYAAAWSALWSLQ